MTTPDQFGERLPRRLGLWSAVAVAVGSTIGSGIFRTPASVAARVPDVGIFLAIWVVGAVVALCGALTYAELSAMLPGRAPATLSSSARTATFWKAPAPLW